MPIDETLDKVTDNIIRVSYKFILSNISSKIALFFICLHLLLSSIQITYFQTLFLSGIMILFVRSIFFRCQYILNIIKYNEFGINVLILCLIKYLIRNYHINIYLIYFIFIVLMYIYITIKYSINNPIDNKKIKTYKNYIKQTNRDLLICVILFMTHIYLFLPISIR